MWSAVEFVTRGEDIWGECGDIFERPREQRRDDRFGDARRAVLVWLVPIAGDHIGRSALPWLIGSDRSGPRVQCSVLKRPGACENAARYYIAKIELLVVDALRVQLDKPDLIKEYVKTYREERNRAERAARKQRGNLEREHAKAKAEIQRMVGAIAKGTARMRNSRGDKRLRTHIIEFQVVRFC